MKYPKWISFGRKEKAKDDIASIDNIKDGSKLGKRKGSILRETLSPVETSSQYAVDTRKNVAIGSALEIPGTKTSIVPPKGASLSNKRKSWYSKSSKNSEGCKPSSTNQDKPRDQIGTLKDLKVTTRQSTKHTRKDIPKTSSENPITIIVTSPTSDCDAQEQDWSSTSNRASSLSLSSLSSTSSLDTTRLMPPSTSTSTTQRCPKSNEAPEVKKWLIGCMNRKADTFPRKLIYRMMDIYNIKENELDAKMLEKLREGIEDEGVVFQVDVENESDRNKKEEFNGVEALQSLRTSFRSQVHGEGKEKRVGKSISGHLNDTITTKRSSKSSSSNNNNNNNSINNIKPKEQTPPKVVPGTNPRIWQKPSSRSRNWPTTNINTSHGVSFPFPPYTHPSTISKQRSSPSKNNSYLHSVNGYSKRGKRGSTISLSSIPEHGVSVGFDVYGFDGKGKGRWEQRAGKSKRASWDVGGGGGRR